MQVARQLVARMTKGNNLAGRNRPSGSPIRPWERAKVDVEAAIFLDDEDEMIDAGDVLSLAVRGCARSETTSITRMQSKGAASLRQLRAFLIISTPRGSPTGRTGSYDASIELMTTGGAYLLSHALSTLIERLGKL